MSDEIKPDPPLADQPRADQPRADQPTAAEAVQRTELANNDNTFWPLHPDSLRLSRWIGAVWIAIVTLIGVAILVGVAMAGPIGTELIWVTIAIVLVIALIVFGGWIYPGSAYRHASWRINADGLEIRRGVWWRHRIIVPHSRMQHSDIEQGPLQRLFSLATLVINTAGTQDASVQLSGLTFETAERLRDELMSGTWRSAGSR